MSLQKAIAALDAEVVQLSKMPEGSSGWYLRQAKSFGVSLMRRAAVLGIDEPVLFDQYRQRLRRDLMQATADD